MLEIIAGPGTSAKEQQFADTVLKMLAAIGVEDAVVTIDDGCETIEVKAFKDGREHLQYKSNSTIADTLWLDREARQIVLGIAESILNRVEMVELSCSKQVALDRFIAASTIWFEPHTGLIRLKESHSSNFKQYQLDCQYSWSVTTKEWLEKHIRAAWDRGEGTGANYTYTPEFLQELEEMEAATRSKMERMAKYL